MGILRPHPNGCDVTKESVLYKNKVQHYYSNYRNMKSYGLIVAKFFSYASKGGVAVKLRRSIVFCTGVDYESIKENLLKMISTVDCDSICIDLEDGVVKTKKAEARLAVARLLQETDFKGKEKVVRVNEPGTPYFDEDIEIILPAMPDALRIPKCERVETLLALDRRISAFEDEHQLPRNTIELILLIESPLGIRNAYELASCCDRITAAGIGMEDLTSELHMNRYYDDAYSDDLLYERQKFVLDVKAAGKQVIDSMSWWPMPEEQYIQYQRDYAQRSYRMGYDGKSCRDARDTDIANAAYRPSEEQVEWGKQVTTAYEKAEQDGSIPYVNGKNICTARYNKGKFFKEYDELIAKRERDHRR